MTVAGSEFATIFTVDEGLKYSDFINANAQIVDAIHDVMPLLLGISVEEPSSNGEVYALCVLIEASLKSLKAEGGCLDELSVLHDRIRPPHNMTRARENKTGVRT